ncbi:F-box protein [Acrasis kona]|uniref:F-box protein n=1 Tax=Acrasis kona TaxID=1008807 RepID=A0AAW2ZFA3_9EUKA
MRELRDIFSTHRQDRSNVYRETGVIDDTAQDDIKIKIIVPPPIMYDSSRQTSDVHISDIYDDVLLYTFSFLESRDLITVGQTCRRWREVSSGDMMWRRELQNFFTNTNQKKNVEQIDGDYKRVYFKMKYAHNHLEEFHKRISNIRNCQIWTAIIIGLFIPLSLCFGALYLSIMAPLFLDGQIQTSPENLWYSSVPEWILLFAPFLVFIVTMTIIFVLFVPQSKYAKKVQLIQFFELQWNTYFESAFISIWVVGWLAWVPIMFLGLYLRLLIVPFFPNSNMSFRLAFVPVYLYTAVYIAAPLYTMVQWSLLRKPLMKWSLGCYIVGVIINVLVSIQCGLISGKLDSSLDSYWSSIFTPMWLVHALLLLFPGVCCLEAVHPWRLRFVKVGAVMAVCEIFLLPVQIWLILFSLRLDSFISVSFVATFIPLYVIIFILLLIGLCATGYTIINTKFLHVL